jgi:hypothetical protein
MSSWWAPKPTRPTSGHLCPRSTCAGKRGLRRRRRGCPLLAEHDAELLTGAPDSNVALNGGRLALNDGGMLDSDRLLLAPGATHER